MRGDTVGAQVRRVPWAVTETVAGETVLLDPVGDRYLKLNSSGAALWELLSEPQRASDLARSLAECHGIGEERASCDANAFLDALRARGLLEEVN
jgi:hypothetical protein